MGRIKVISLSREEQAELVRGYREGKSHVYRQRCKMILLKSEGKTSKAIGEVLGYSNITVNSWLKRYEQAGIVGLETRPGRGRRSILSEEDTELVKEQVSAHRQKLSVAKEELEQLLGKSFSQDTLKRYLKKTHVVINGSESVPTKSHVRRFTHSEKIA
jgi:transposase